MEIYLTQGLDLLMRNKPQIDEFIRQDVFVQLSKHLRVITDHLVSDVCCSVQQCNQFSKTDREDEDFIHQTHGDWGFRNQSMPVKSA